MPFESFAEFYKSDAQSVFLLHALPIAFLGFRAAATTPHTRAAVPAASSFVAAWCLAFAFETLLDPWATGPLIGALGAGDGFGGSAIMFVFVWLGDFRVLGLIFAVAATSAGQAVGGALARAALLTCLVPVAAGVLNAALGAAIPGLPGATLWVIYELGFLSLAIYLGRSWIPNHVDDPRAAAYLRALAGYSAAYYALWASADVVILGLGSDAGWALRVVPNQLYYGGWVIFAFAWFYREAPNASDQAASSTSTHASR